MRKDTRSGGGRKPKAPLQQLSPRGLREKTKTKFISKGRQQVNPQLQSSRISELLSEEILSCSICLQLLLWPAFAQCGHSFCLCCAEDLARNGFACGICHTHLPSYDLQRSPTIEKLVSEFLWGQQSCQRQNYAKRSEQMQRKQEKRRIKQIQEGNLCDYWCEQDLAWRSGTVTEKTKKGNLTITPNSHPKELSIHIQSRRLAPYRTFTKDDPLQEQPQFHFRPVSLAATQEFESIRLRMPETPYIFGMPLFLGYYWRDGHFRDPQLPEQSDHGNPFTF